MTQLSPPPLGSSLLRLSDELLEEIANHSTLADLVRFRPTSRRLLLATSRLFGHNYLRELHLSMVAMDKQRIQTMVQYSTHNIWQACKLTRVFIRVWPFMADCPESCPIPHTGSARRVLCPSSFLAHLKDMRNLLAVLPDSVHTVALVPFRPSEPSIFSDWQPRCEYFHTFQVALRQSGVQIPNIVVYSDNRPVMDYEVMGDHLSHLLSAQGTTWPSNQIQPYEPGCLETDHTTNGAGTSLTIHGRLDLSQLQRPAVPLFLNHLQLLTLTSGRMGHHDILTLLRAHRNTLCKILFHNIILERSGYRNIFNEMIEGERYPHLIHFEIMNAWERDVERVSDLQVSAVKVYFCDRDGADHAVGKVRGGPVETRGKIGRLVGSLRFLSVAQASRGMGGMV